MSAPIIIAEIENYVTEKKDFILNLLKGGTHSLLVSNTGCGKALKNGTKVLTEQGFKKIESLKIGQMIYGENGNLYPVLGVYPQGKKQAWDIVFSNGTTIQACGEHLWSYFYEKNPSEIITKNTKEIAELLKQKEQILLPTLTDHKFEKWGRIVATSANYLSIQQINFSGEEVDMTCIATANPSKLFIIEGFIPTHNTTLCLEIAKENRYSVLLSPTRVIVDQFILSAEKQGLKVISHEEMDNWAFGEFQIEGQGKIWIGTFAALEKAHIDWDLCDYVFIDEIHFLLDLSLFGKESALAVWQLTQTISKYPNVKLISLTASDELVLPLKNLFKFDKIFLAKSEKWRLRPNRVILYPTIRDLSNIRYILHYIKHYVKENEKVLCVVKSYKELKQLRDYKDYLPSDVEIANAQDKKDTETYWEICINSAYPKRVKVFITTTWISLGASIHDPEVKHVICTFPNYSIVHQSLSRVRSGAVNVAVMQLPSKHDAPPLEMDLETISSQALAASRNNANLDYFTAYKGEWMFFPLERISEAYQRQQEYLFSDLYLLSKTLQNNLDCKVEILWEELLPYRQLTLTKREFVELQQKALFLKFPIVGERAFQKALQLEIRK